MIDESSVERVLAVMAHPDDVDFSTAGTIATWTSAGIEVTYLMVTSGDAGGFDPSVPRSQIAGIRQAEQRAAAAAVGVSDVRFLDYPDGKVEVSLDLRRDIAGVIREVRPQRLVCPSPVRNMVRMPSAHPDHTAVGEAALCAMYPDARNPFVFTDSIGHLEAWSVAETWVIGMERTNHYVDVTDVFDRKVAALLEHKSQIKDPDAIRSLLTGFLGAQAQAAGFAEGRLAEGFWVMETG